MLKQGAGIFLRSMGMQIIVAKKQEWVAPKLQKLGKISDVAGVQVAGPQGGGAKS